MVDKVEWDLSRSAIVVSILELISSEVGLRHQVLEVAAIEQAIIDLIAHDFIEMPSFVWSEELQIFFIFVIVSRMLPLLFFLMDPITLFIESSRRFLHSLEVLFGVSWVAFVMFCL